MILPERLSLAVDCILASNELLFRSEKAAISQDKWRALTDYWKRSPYLLKLVESESGE